MGYQGVIMSNLTVEISIVNGNYQITAHVTSTGDMPADIFMYENVGSTILGQYQGVCTLEEYKSLQTFSGAAIPSFGNRFVKTSSLIMSFPLSTDAVSIKTKIIKDVKAFKAAYDAAATSVEVVHL